MPNYNPDASQTRQPSGRFGSKMVENPSPINDDVNTEVQRPVEPKIRDLFQRRIFETNAGHFPYVALTVANDVNEGYRLVLGPRKLIGQPKSEFPTSIV